MNGSTPSPDLFLARRAAAGHEDAWADLIDRHGRRLYNLALQFSGGREGRGSDPGDLHPALPEPQDLPRRGPPHGLGAAAF